MLYLNVKQTGRQAKKKIWQKKYYDGNALINNSTIKNVIHLNYHKRAFASETRMGWGSTVERRGYVHNNAKRELIFSWIR